MKNIHLVFLIILYIYSCDDKGEDDFSVIDFDKAKASTLLSDIAEEIIYIPLNDGYHFRRIHTLKIYEEYIIMRTSEGVLVYDRQGAFIRKIGREGRGPGEIGKYLSDIAYDPIEEHVYILDGMSKKIAIFNIMGSFVREIRLKDGLDRIEILDDKIVLLESFKGGKAKFDWIVFDKQGNQVSAKLNTIDPFKNGTCCSSRPYCFDNAVYDFDNLMDTVYRINADASSTVGYVFKHSKPIEGVQSKKGYYLLAQMFETTKYVFLSYGVPDGLEQTVYNKKTGEYSIYNKTDLYMHFLPGEYQFNDIDGGKWRLLETSFSDESGDYLCIKHNTLDLKEYIKSNAFQRIKVKQQLAKENYRKFVENLKEDANPVLMLVKLKT